MFLVSFNCVLETLSIGAGTEGDHSVDFISDDLYTIIKFMETLNLSFHSSGKVIGEYCSINTDCVIGELRDTAGDICAVVLEDKTLARL
jgi:hypothetical protein